MKYLSIFVLAVFINFTALPSIAVIFDWEIPTLNNNISEEEVKNNLANYNEKFPQNLTISKILWEFSFLIKKSANTFLRTILFI